MNNPKINWFPGHMKIATDAIKNMHSKIDLILEVVDARGVNISSNFELHTLLPNRPIIKIALKSDIADLVSKNLDEKIIFCSKYQKNIRASVLQAMNQAMHEKTLKLKSKGLVSPNYNVIVIGLPNIGKSTLINLLLKRTKTKVENRPGVTRSISIWKLNETFNLFDTPGVLFKKIDDFETGAKLTLMGIIKNDVVPLNDILMWAYDFFKAKYFHLLKKHYEINETLDYKYFLESIAKKRNLISKFKTYNIEQAASIFFNDISNGYIGKISYE